MKKFNVMVNGESFEVLVEEAGVAAAPAGFKTVPAPARIAPPAPRAVAPPAPMSAAPAASASPAAPKPVVSHGAGTVTAPMPGNVNALKVNVGDQVKSGDVLLVLEAMKMENEITAPVSGAVKEIAVKQGQTVQSGDVMVVLG